MSVDKSNRISDDSGVVCFNAMDDLLQSPNSLNDTPVTTSESTTVSSSVFLQREKAQLKQVKDSESSSDTLFQYKSVYKSSSGLQSPTPSILNAPVPVRRRPKKGKYVTGSGQAPPNGTPEEQKEENSQQFGKYGTKRISHVQQMRMRFESWCKINNQAKICEAESCKGICEQQFDSLPIIPIPKSPVESPPPTTLIGVTNVADKQQPESLAHNLSSENQLSCECDDNVPGEELRNNEGVFQEMGPLPVTGAKIDFQVPDTHESNNSDFEEDEVHEESHSDPVIFEVKNAELCETLDEDDFEEVLLDDVDSFNDVSPSQTTRPDLLNKTFTNLLNIVDELISCEQTYISSLEAGVRDYKAVFSDPEFVKTLPDGLRGKDGVIFGNIDRICDFHRDELLPKLLECDRNVTKICEVFCDFIQKDYFYKYVLYAINRTRSEQVCSRNTEFFKRRQEQIGDRLGLNSFLVKPIQRLPHYKMLFNQMIVELLKNMSDDSLKPLIAICCKTEKYVQRLLDNVNESMHINDIEECYEFNILHQGKFRKMDVFDIYEKFSNYRYKGRMFLFDKSLVFTEQTSKNRLIYKGHFLKTKIGLEPERSTAHSPAKPKLILFSEKVGQQCIEVSSDTPVIYEWKSLIDDIIRSFIVEERERVKKGKKNRAVTFHGTPITPELRSTSRGSIYSIKSLASDVSSLSSGSDRSSKISVDSRLGPLSPDAEKVNRRTTWYTEL